MMANAIRVEIVSPEVLGGLPNSPPSRMLKFILLLLEEGNILLVGHMEYHAYLLIPRTDLESNRDLFERGGEKIKQHPLAKYVVAAGTIVVRFATIKEENDNIVIPAWDSVGFGVITSPALRDYITTAITSSVVREAFSITG